MSKVTSKLQLTVPKAMADRLGIRPGAEVDWVEAGESLRLVLRARPRSRTIRERLRVFDEATARQRTREAERPLPRTDERGWTREELYERGRPR